MKISPPPMAFLEYVFVPIHSIVSNSLWPHVFSLLGSCVHEFSRQEYRNGLPFPPPGDLPDSGIKPVSLESPALAGRFFTPALSGKPSYRTTSKKRVKKLFQNSTFKKLRSWHPVPSLHGK